MIWYRSAASSASRCRRAEGPPDLTRHDLYRRSSARHTGRFDRGRIQALAAAASPLPDIVNIGTDDTVKRKGSRYHFLGSNIMTKVVYFIVQQIMLLFLAWFNITFEVIFYDTQKDNKYHDQK